MKGFRPILLFFVLNEEKPDEQGGSQTALKLCLFSKEGMKSCSYIIYEWLFTFTAS